MSTNTISINYSSTSSDKYWVKIVQEGKDDLATLGDVATLVDKMYGVGYCSGETIVDDTGSTDIPDPTPEELIDVAKDTLDLKQCKLALSGTYEVDVDIIRSDISVPYTLKLSTNSTIAAALGSTYGALDSPEVVSTKVIDTVMTERIDVNMGTYVDLGYPMLGNLSMSWEGNITLINNTGMGSGYSGTNTNNISDSTLKYKDGTIYWEGEITGTIVATYHTIFDRVTLHVPGLVPTGSDVGKALDCYIAVFYYHQVYTGTVTPPSADSKVSQVDINSICGPTSIMAELNNPVQVGDPYASPPIDNFLYGCVESDHRLADPARYLEDCCVVGAASGCTVYRTRKRKKNMSDADKEYWTARLQPEKVKFIALPPCGSLWGCGDHDIVAGRQPHDCCDTAPPIVWSTSNSIQVLAPNQDGVVMFTGGKASGQYFWKIRGKGFRIGTKYNVDYYTYTPYIKVYALPDACGHASITVSDECTEAVGGVRSTAGKWVQRLSFTPDPKARVSDFGGYNSSNPMGNPPISVTQNQYSGGGRYFMTAPYGTNNTGLDGQPFVYGFAFGSVYVPIGNCLDGISIPVPGFPFSVILYSGCYNWAGIYTFSEIVLGAVLISEWVC